MVNLIIDNVEVEVKEGTSIMDAAKFAGVDIPRLCFLRKKWKLLFARYGQQYEYFQYAF